MKTTKRFYVHITLYYLRLVDPPGAGLRRASCGHPEQPRRNLQAGGAHRGQGGACGPEQS